jgi:hypothetical protein
MAERFRSYGRPQPRAQRSEVIMTTLHPDAYEAVTETMRRLGISKSGAVHHLVRLAAGLKPLDTF